MLVVRLSAGTGDGGMTSGGSWENCVASSSLEKILNREPGYFFTVCRASRLLVKIVQPEKAATIPSKCITAF